MDTDCETAGPQKKKIRPKKVNKPYTREQELFIVYHRADRKMTWAELRDAYMARFLEHVWGVRRTAGGMQCAYYRSNGRMPETTADGLLVLTDSTDKKTTDEGLDGVRYMTFEHQVRESEIKLIDRFPEEMVDPKYDWVLPEHREEARPAAERRNQQRWEWLHKKAAAPAPAPLSAPTQSHRVIQFRANL